MRVQNISSNNYQNQPNFKAVYIKPSIKGSDANYFKLKDFIDLITAGKANERKSMAKLAGNLNKEQFSFYREQILAKEKGLNDLHWVNDIFYSDEDLITMRRTEKKIDAAINNGDDEKAKKASERYLKKAVKIAREAVEILPEQLDAAINKFEQAKQDALKDLKII